MSNPYKSSTGQASQGDYQPDTAESGRTLSKWFTIPVGAIGGGLMVAIVAAALAFLVLIPPMSRVFGLGGEFDTLLPMALPILALPGGVFGGLVYGGTWKLQRGYWIALAVASLPAAAYFFANAWANEMSKNPRDQFYSTLVCSICMVLSAAISLKLVGKGFAAIDRNRASRLSRA